MTSWAWQQWLVVVLGLAALITGVVLFLLGLSVAVTAGDDVDPSSAASTRVSSLLPVATYAGGVAVALAVTWVATKGVERRLATKGASYLQFLGVSVSALTWAMGVVVTDDQLVAGALLAVAGAVGIGAGSATQRWPIIGVSLYAAVPVGTLVTAS